MITTIEAFKTSTAKAVIITLEIAKELYKKTKNTDLKVLIAKGGNKIAVTRSVADEVISRLGQRSQIMKAARGSRKGVGGRKRLPDPSNVEIENMSEEERRKYNNRIWQRQSRANRGITAHA